MVGVEAEARGIIRAGAEMVETMACATVPKIVLTLNHASGAGYYAMAGQGFDPIFTFSWPTARIGVMEGDSAVQAVHGNAAPGRPKRSRRSRKRAPITSTGSMRSTPRRAATGCGDRSDPVAGGARAGARSGGLRAASRTPGSGDALMV